MICLLTRREVNTVWVRFQLTIRPLTFFHLFAAEQFSIIPLDFYTYRLRRQVHRFCSKHIKKLLQCFPKSTFKCSIHWLVLKRRPRFTPEATEHKNLMARSFKECLPNILIFQRKDNPLFWMLRFLILI